MIFGTMCTCYVSFDPEDPVEPVRAPAFLDVQHFIADLVGNWADLKCGVHWDAIVDSLVFDVLDSTDDDCSTSPKALHHLTLLLPLYHLVDRYLPHRYLVLLFVPKQSLHGEGVTSMESRVTPGRIRSSRGGVAT